MDEDVKVDEKIKVDENVKIDDKIKIDENVKIDEPVNFYKTSTSPTTSQCTMGKLKNEPKSVQL